MNHHVTLTRSEVDGVKRIVFASSTGAGRLQIDPKGEAILLETVSHAPVALSLPTAIALLAALGAAIIEIGGDIEATFEEKVA